MKRGDIVKFTEQWSEPSERDCRMVIIEAFDDVERALIGHLNTSIIFGYTERVTYDMIQVCSEDEKHEAISKAEHSYDGIRLETL